MDSQNSTYLETLKKLEQMFPDQLLLSVEDLSKITKLEVRTIYKGTGRKASRKLPIEPVRLNTRLLRFRIHDVARMISSD